MNLSARTIPMKKICLLLAITFAPAAGAAYKCVDEKGRTHIGDTPPAGCANVLMYEVTRSGKILRTIEPTMTDEQVRAKAEEAVRRKEADRAAAEQKRKDTALLATYSSEAEFDVVREHTVAPINGRIRSAQERIKEVEKRTRKVEEELEFYKAGKGKSKRGGEPPPMMVSELERLVKEKQTLEKNIADYEKEIGELSARFEVDKQRWLALKTRGTNPAASSSTVSAPARR